MMTWALILFIGSGGYMNGKAITAVPGFTREACELAARRAQYELGVEKAICVQQSLKQ